MDAESISAWFTLYLDDCSQQMPSDSMPVTVGVPQGLILGPLLLIIFVNDMPESVKHSSIDLHADDTTMKTAHHELGVTEQRLNEDLVSLIDSQLGCLQTDRSLTWTRLSVC